MAKVPGWAKALHKQYQKYIEYYATAAEMAKVRHYQTCLQALIAQYPSLGD